MYSIDALLTQYLIVTTRQKYLQNDISAIASVRKGILIKYLIVINVSVLMWIWD